MGLWNIGSILKKKLYETMHYSIVLLLNDLKTCNECILKREVYVPIHVRKLRKLHHYHRPSKW